MSRQRSPLAEAVEQSGVVVTQMLIVEDIERSVRFYRDVMDAEVMRENARCSGSTTRGSS